MMAARWCGCLPEQREVETRRTDTLAVIVDDDRFPFARTQRLDQPQAFGLFTLRAAEDVPS